MQISRGKVPLPGNWKRQLLGAAGRGDVGELRRLQAAGADLSVRDGWGYTLLHYAARDGHAECVQWLLEQGLSPHSTTNDGDATPLHMAAYWGELETVRLLLDSGADPAARDSDGRTALDYAISKRRLTVADLLRRRTLEGQVPLPGDWEVQLRMAAERGDVGALRRLQAAGADLSVRDGRGRTLLHCAAGEGHAECVQWLLEQGLSLHSTGGGFAWTPLHQAACNGRLEAVRLLLDSGADPAARDSYGRTALDIATSRDHSAVADLLRRRT